LKKLETKNKATLERNTTTFRTAIIFDEAQQKLLQQECDKYLYGYGDAVRKHQEVRLESEQLSKEVNKSNS
jgi:hypothetical protein